MVWKCAKDLSYELVTIGTTSYSSLMPAGIMSSNSPAFLTDIMKLSKDSSSSALSSIITLSSICRPLANVVAQFSDVREVLVQPEQGGGHVELLLLPLLLLLLDGCHARPHRVLVFECDTGAYPAARYERISARGGPAHRTMLLESISWHRAALRPSLSVMAYPS